MAYMVGGFFGFIGKAIKKVAHVVGKVAGTAVGVASLVVPGPAGRIVAGIGGKLAGVGRVVRSAKGAIDAVQAYNSAGGSRMGMSVIKVPGLLNKQSSVMPGGAVATVGNAAGKRRYGGTKRKRTTRRVSGKVKRSIKRKLKFGSPAWRKKYLGHKR